MTNIWEQNIKEWYEKSDTSRLSYLDLAHIEKPSNKELAHNISVIYDRVCLSSKVHLKEFRDSQIHILSLEKQIVSLVKRTSKLEEENKNLAQLFLEQRPITSLELKNLVRDSQKEQGKRLSQIEDLLQQIKGSLIE